MNTTIDTYCGSPIEIESEKVFCGKLSEDLLARSRSALIFANFFPPKNPLQIDFLVMTGACACHVELKRLTAPVVGGLNGPWSLQLPNGALSRMEQGKNPYLQTLQGKYAISDQMHAFARANATIPPAGGGKFYQRLESVVCVYPELLPGSKIYQDHKVRVMGYAELLALLLSGTINPGWTRQHWVNFAMHMGLVRVRDDTDGSPPEVVAARQAVADYARRFEDYHSKGLPRLVPTRLQIGPDTVPSDALLDRAIRGRHLQLVGPSGCGKTLLARHMALTAARGGRLPIVAQAREYEGKLSALLDRSVAYLYPDTALHLVGAAARVGTPLVLFLDGFNECPKARQAGLLKDLQAFCLRWQVPVVITSQEKASVAEMLAGEVVCFQPTLKEERHAVLRSYLGGELPGAAEALVGPFRTPYELSLAAECLRELESPPTRTALFDAYVRRRCDGSEDAEVTRATLCAIADRMRRQLTNSLPMTVVRRAAQAVVRREGGRMRSLNDTLACGLVDVRQGRCSFRHEMLERFLQAEALSREAPSPSELAAQLTRPRNRALAEFIITSETDQDGVRQCLESLADAAAVGECLRGAWGPTVMEIAVADCYRVLQKADRMLDQIDLELGPGALEHLVVSGSPLWSAYECLLLQAIGGALACGQFLGECFRLVRRTEEVCRDLISIKEGTPGSVTAEAASSIFVALFVNFISHEPAMPVSEIYHVCRFRYASGAGPLDRACLDLWMNRLEELLPGELLLLCGLFRKLDGGQAEGLTDLLRRCWRSGPYHLRLEALWLAESFAGRLGGDARKEVAAFLDSLRTQNIMLSSALVETLMAYGLVSSPVSADDAAEELADILRSPDDPLTRRRAYEAVAGIFEEVYQGTFGEALGALPVGDRCRLLTMAALGAAEYCMFTAWVLRELIRLGDPIALPAFLHHASSLDPETPSPQEVVAGYAIALAGCARFMDSPPPLTSPRDDYGRAWEAYGAILFWLSKPGISAGRLQEACLPLWRLLRSEVPFEAVDPLFRLDRSGWKSSGEDAFRPLESLCAAFPKEVRQILEFGLQHQERLAGLFDARFGGEGRTCFIVRCLGAIGDRQTVKLLDALTDSAELGSEAVEAIRRLNARLDRC